MEDPETQELRLDELERERAEREAAGGAESEREQRTHERRADRHAYLREKLEERARSEEESG